MTIHKLTVATLFASLVATTALARGAPFSVIDTDDDGVLSYEELTTQFGTDGADAVLATADADGDESLTLDELRTGGDTLRQAEHESNDEDEADTDGGEADADEDEADGRSGKERRSPPRNGRGGRP